MTIAERTLEEDEAKIDNLLHKILESNEMIEQLVTQIKERSDDGFILERARMITILTETIENLSKLADEIDLDDEKLLRHKKHIQNAIGTIKDASTLLGK